MRLAFPSTVQCVKGKFDLVCEFLSFFLSAFASSTEAELRVSYALIPWSVSVFCVPLQLCTKWVSWPGDSDFGTIERLKPGTGEIPLLFSNDPKGSFRCNEPPGMNHRQFTHHSAFDNQSSSIPRKH